MCEFIFWVGLMSYTFIVPRKPDKSEEEPLQPCPNVTVTLTGGSVVQLGKLAFGCKLYSLYSYNFVNHGQFQNQLTQLLVLTNDDNVAWSL